MYASIWNHLFHFSHYLFAFVMLYLLYPMLIYEPGMESRLDRVVSNYLRMVFIMICAGYLLVLLKIFEFLGLAVALILIKLLSLAIRRAKGNAENKSFEKAAIIYDVADGLKSPAGMIGSSLKNWRKGYIKQFRISLSNGFDVYEAAIIGIVFIIAIYIRFYDAYYNAAPGMSDGNVTLAWTKYIIQRRLFADGIYPQGFHIYMAIIQKIAFINPLYVVKYSGPINGILVMSGIYFFIYRCTGRRIPGLLGAALYGVFGNHLSMEWMRQAASNSQEFGYVFVLPVIYFALKYLQQDHEDSFWSYFFGVSAIGLIHTIAYVFAAIGVVILAIVALLSDYRKNISRVLKLGFGGLTSGIAAVIPMVIGIIAGKSFHSSSAQYLESKMAYVYYPTLDYMDYTAIAAIGVLLLYVLINISHLRSLLAENFIICFSASAFLIFYYGGAITGSELIVSRFPDLWILSMPISIGMAVNVLGKLIRNKKWHKPIELIMISCLLAFGVFYLKPQPILTYKMERNEEVEQYLRITKMCNPTEWMMVANFEGAYAQVLGVGTHIRIEDFVRDYDPKKETLFYKDTNHTIKDIFIYHDKQDFSTSFANKQKEYEERKVQNEAIHLWINEYKRVNPERISLMYQDDNFEIFHIHQEETQDDIIEKIWR